VCGKGFLRMRIELAGTNVPLNGGIEPLRVEGLKPRAKPRQLARRKLFDGFFDVFGGGHVGDIAFVWGAEKGGMQGVGWVEPFAKPIDLYVANDGYRCAPPILRATGYLW